MIYRRSTGHDLSIVKNHVCVAIRINYLNEKVTDLVMFRGVIEKYLCSDREIYLHGLTYIQRYYLPPIFSSKSSPDRLIRPNLTFRGVLLKNAWTGTTMLWAWESETYDRSSENAIRDAAKAIFNFIQFLSPLVVRSAT